MAQNNEEPQQCHHRHENAVPGRWNWYEGNYPENDREHENSDKNGDHMNDSDTTDQTQAEAPKPLEESFKKGGNQYTQIWREGEVAIYRRESPHWIDYEVVRIRSQKASSFERDGVKVETEAKELYPYDEQWGTHGWTLRDEESAIQKFVEVRDRLAAQSAESKKVPLGAEEGQETRTGSETTTEALP